MREVWIPCLDPNEAPKGYHAVLKSDAKIPSPTGGFQNICRACDWRLNCQDSETDLTRHEHRCMASTVVTQAGKRVRRHDGCSVVFKANTPAHLPGLRAERNKMTIEQMIDALLSKHRGDARAVIAWFFGYTESIQQIENEIRAALGVDPRETLIERLEREANKEVSDGCSTSAGLDGCQDVRHA